MLPAPNLDDRHFQDLVDDAKRLVQQRCPTWTDHNVSDPGVTLIEAFAQMVDQLIYRLNRVPDLHYVKFLELIGVELRPPAAARGEVTFWLSAPQPQIVVVRAETQVATPRTDVADPVVFSTTRELEIIPCEFASAGSQPAGEAPSDMTAALAGPEGFALLLGLAGRRRRVAGRAVRGRAVLRGPAPDRLHGVRARRRSRVDHRWSGRRGPRGAGSSARSVRDDTGGLNKPGDVILHVPGGHTPSILARQRGGWLRCRLIQAEPDQPTYTASPADPVGLRVHHRRHRTYRARRGGARRDPRPLRRHPRPAVRRSSSARCCPSEEPSTITAVQGETTQRRGPRSRTSPCSGPNDRHFRIDGSPARSSSGPAVRAADGDLVHYGAVPPAGAVLRLEALPDRGWAGPAMSGVVRSACSRRRCPYVSTGGEPGAGDRRGRGREPDRRQDPRAVAAPLPRSGGDGRGLRAAGPRRRSGRRPSALRRRHRGRRRGRTGAGRAAGGQRRARPDQPGRPAAPAGHAGTDLQQPRRPSAGRHPAARPAARLRLADRGGQPELPVRCSIRERSGPRCSGRSTRCITRWSAARTAPAGRSAGRCSRTRCTPHSPRIPGVDMAREVSVAMFPAEEYTGRRGAATAADRHRPYGAGLLLRPPGQGPQVSRLVGSGGRRMDEQGVES